MTAKSLKRARRRCSGEARRRRGRRRRPVVGRGQEGLRRQVEGASGRRHQQGLEGLLHLHGEVHVIT